MAHSGRITGRTALVTGSARGIGLAIAERFAMEGANVVLADIDAEQIEQGVSRIRERGGIASGYVADVGLAEDVDSLFERVVESHGGLDILVNNAALTQDQRHFFLGDETWWDNYLRVNLKGLYLCTDRAARLMAARGGGAIINLSSGGATRAHRGMVAYDAAKGGVEAFTRSVALELAPYGVRVNALVPGLIATDPDEPEWSLKRRDETVPLGRGGKSQDLAGPALFLASDDAGYVTGATLAVDGGVLVQQRSPQVDTLKPSEYPPLDAVAGAARA
jgi:NAD(P)-dependent dehydrogenase (short-subunit alcohol dehydrogenase family)